MNIYRSIRYFKQAKQIQMQKINDIYDIHYQINSWTKFKNFFRKNLLLNSNKEFFKNDIKIQQEYKRYYKKNDFKIKVLFFIALIILLFNFDKNDFDDSSQLVKLLKFYIEKEFKIKQDQNSKERFSDIKGCDEAIEELKEIQQFLINPEKFLSIGATVPKGVLMTGPPGVGKTMLAKALAGETQAKFYYFSGSEFQKPYVGQGAMKVQQIFNEARQNSPAIIFIDEIDSIGSKRTNDQTSFKRQTLNQILAEMDGFDNNDQIIVFAATNLEDQIDPALKRAGRFDKIIRLSSPDIKARQQLFDIYISKVKADKNINLKNYAQRTIGFTGADIKNMINIAAIRAVRQQKQQLDNLDLDFAYDRLKMGIRKNLNTININDFDQRATAILQLGLAWPSLISNYSNQIYKVSILPSGDELGYTAFQQKEDQTSQSKQEILELIDTYLGGRVAEEIFLNNNKITSQSSKYLQKATQIATNYISQLGMQDKFQVLSINKQYLSEEMKSQLDTEVEKLLQQRYQKLKILFQESQQQFNCIVNELIKNESLDQKQLYQLLKHQLIYKNVLKGSFQKFKDILNIYKIIISKSSGLTLISASSIIIKISSNVSSLIFNFLYEIRNFIIFLFS